MNWLAAHFQTLTLDDDQEGYLLGRGAQEPTIERLGIKTWQALDEPCDDPVFCERYGDKGERLGDWMLWPLFSPKGRVIGCAGREGTKKNITRYMLPAADWNPVWTGLTPETMQRIWDGADLWVVEGIFDLFPMEWAIPDGDVVLGSERARLTDKHVEFIRRFMVRAGRCPNLVHMVYDNDETGKKGVHGWTDETGKVRWGAIKRLERVGVKATAPPYRAKDPGDIWSQQGAAGIRAAFN